MPKYSCFISFLIVCLSSPVACANIVLGGTRLIYPAGEREVTIALANKGVTPSLVQSWMDDGATNSTPENSSAPFFVMPPISRIEGQASQTLRILFNGAKLPEDKEAVFYLNVLEIPPVAANSKDKNNLLLAVQSRIKVFYRPEKVKETLEEAAKTLKWHLIKEDGQWKLSCTNNSPLHISFANIQVTKDGGSLGNKEGTHMVAPGKKEVFRLVRQDVVRTGAGDGQVQFEYINDYGALKMLSSQAI
ncbi:molecular chaperone [Pseudomonas sp. NPDC087803]|uniref:fimbrial biogenesis chaperone n=1 Tax=Pseudomonas sp. NPDC087803 TaxID=3364448 RepID=UPI003801416B